MDEVPNKVTPAHDDTTTSSAPAPNKSQSAAPGKSPVKKAKPTATAGEPRKASAKKSAPPPWTFPKNTLEDALKIPRAIEEQNAGNPMKPDILAKAVGFNAMADWRFLDLLRSANQYGLVLGVGKIQPVSLTDIGRDVVAPSSPSARPRALLAAFRTVEDFRKVEEFYKGKNCRRTSFSRTRCIENSAFLASASEPSSKPSLAT